MGVLKLKKCFYIKTNKANQTPHNHDDCHKPELGIMTLITLSLYSITTIFNYYYY